MKKRMLSLLLAVALVLGLCPGVFAAGSSYADVLDTHWAHPYIEDVTEKGIMNGVDDKNFAPEDAMTRAMFVTVLARLSGDTLTEQTSFSDVPAGQWYSAAVSWAAENGIVLGYPDGTFAPDKAVSREDAMTLLVRFAGWKALTLPEGGELTYAMPRASRTMRRKPSPRQRRPEFWPVTRTARSCRRSPSRAPRPPRSSARS